MGRRVHASRLETLMAVLTLVVLLVPAMAGATTATPAATPDGAVAPARTLGDIIERANRGWEQVETLRTRTVIYGGDRDRSTPSASHEPDMGTPPSDLVLATTVQEVIVPDRKRVYQLADGEMYLESLVVDGRVFMRTRVEGEEPPWMEVDFAEIDPDSAEGVGIRTLLMPVEAPFADLPPLAHALTVDRIGTDHVAGRSCEVYRINPPPFDTLLGVERDVLDLTLAISAEGLICWTEDVREQFVVRTTLEMVNEPLTIEIPENIAAMGTPPAP
ncbi:MAG: hypothetical protein M3121_00415 [Chloroflexota bacterium]|nr:hypothetical protein [Chloroflexota bacterium]